VCLSASTHENTAHLDKGDLSSAAFSLRMRRFPSLPEKFDDITPDKLMLPQVECRNEWHHQVHKNKPAPLAVGVMLGAFECEGF